MKLKDILKRKELSLSFEVFPPKSDVSFNNVKDATEKIAALKPSFISVTYGAGGGTKAYTLDVAKNIKENCGVETLAHMTCVCSTKKGIKERLLALKDAGIENIMALRGDIPIGIDDPDRLTWDFQHASDLIKLIKETNPDFCVGGACYPEIHPESSSQKDDIKYLKEKVDAGAEFLTTQMFFDNTFLYKFLYKVKDAGIDCPIVAGVMPITNAAQVKRAVQLSGSFIPAKFKNIVDKFGHDPESMKQAGIAYATDQIIDLYANNVTNVHVYTMNNPDVAKKIQENLSHMIGK